MEHAEISELQTFLGAGILTSGCGLYLPRFSGKVDLTADLGAPPSLRYGGGTYSERDAKAAFYVTSVLGHVLDSDKIRLEEVAEFSPDSGLPHKTAFLFGSRSNRVTRWATENLPESKFFEFEFGERWQIKCEDGSVYSTPDPSKLEPGAYANQTDYGVVSRLSVAATGERLFVLAGLGSRATEGCGHYFSRRWRDLSRLYGDNDFAVVLKFQPPLDPARYEPIAWFGERVG